jgi:hypothetical protein
VDFEQVIMIDADVHIFTAAAGSSAAAAGQPVAPVDWLRLFRVPRDFPFVAVSQDPRIEVSNELNAGVMRVVPHPQWLPLFDATLTYLQNELHSGIVAGDQTLLDHLLRHVWLAMPVTFAPILYLFGDDTDAARSVAHAATATHIVSTLKPWRLGTKADETHELDGLKQQLSEQELAVLQQWRTHWHSEQMQQWRTLFEKYRPAEAESTQRPLSPAQALAAAASGAGAKRLVAPEYKGGNAADAAQRERRRHLHRNEREAERARLAAEAAAVGVPPAPTRAYNSGGQQHYQKPHLSRAQLRKREYERAAADPMLTP